MSESIQDLLYQKQNACYAVVASSVRDM